MIWLAAFAFSIGSVCSDVPLFVPHDEIKIRLYGAHQSYAVWTLGEAGYMFSDSGYNSTREMLMVILGYDEDQDNMLRQTIKALYSRKLTESYNIVAVELPQQFSLSAMNLYYLKPAFHVPMAGEALGEFLNSAVEARHISPAQVNIISFSLGAHIAGYMGRKVNGTLHSITGVDPIGVGYDWSRLLTHLVHVSHDDAQIVHLYHSNSAVFGTTLRLGTADYLFNSGETQPGCNFLDQMCSHLRGFAYYVEALHASLGLPARQCYSHSHLVHCKCKGNRLSYVGFPPDKSASGLYVLHTRGEPPYGLGKDGVAGFHCKREKTDYTYQMGLYYDKLIKMLGEKKSILN